MLHDERRKAPPAPAGAHNIASPVHAGAGPPDKRCRVVDYGPVLAAIDRLVKIAERRAELRGLDSPQRTEITIDDLDRQIALLTAELASND
jgi:hypothetical protein